jgi:CheY-like chemotaxis protein
MTEKPVILCADDTSTMLQGRKILLEKNGYRVLTAANGKEAVQAFVSHTVDLVLLDYRVPQIDGGVAAMHMRAYKPDVPIALLSGDESLPPSALEPASWKKWITC